MEDRLPKSNGDETITCPECQALNKTHAEFCHECGYPFELANLTPVQTIRSQGSFLRNWVERPSRIGLIVMWATHLPIVAVSVFVAIEQVLYREELGKLSSFVFFWIVIAVGFGACVFLYRTTSNYIKRRKRKRPLN